MGIVNLKNLPGLHLNDLLRRKRKSLSQFLDEFGISTYEGLKARCERIGVVAPNLEKFEEARPKLTTSPTEGIIVLDALPSVDEAFESDPFLTKKSKKKKVIPEKNEFIEADPVSLFDDVEEA